MSLRVAPRANLLFRGRYAASPSGLDTSREKHAELLDQRLSFQRSIFHPMGSQIFAKLFGRHRFVICTAKFISWTSIYIKRKQAQKRRDIMRRRFRVEDCNRFARLFFANDIHNFHNGLDDQFGLIQMNIMPAGFGDDLRHSSGFA